MSSFVLRALAPALGFVLAGCSVPPSSEPRREARVEGRVVLAGPPVGNAFLFLFAPDETWMSRDPWIASGTTSETQGG